MSRDIDAVIFDLYGTLVRVTDERRPYRKILRKIALSLFLNGLRRDAVRRVCMTEDMLSLSDVVGRLLPHRRDLDVSKYEAELKKELASVELYPEVCTVLGSLKDEGVKMGLISNLASPYKIPFYLLGLDRYIDTHVFSCEVGSMKPEQEIYEVALDRLGVPAAHTLMVGDSLMNDVLGPAKAGMDSLLLDRADRGVYIRKIRDLSQLHYYV